MDGDIQGDYRRLLIYHQNSGTGKSTSAVSLLSYSAFTGDPGLLGFLAHSTAGLWHKDVMQAPLWVLDMGALLCISQSAI